MKLLQPSRLFFSLVQVVLIFSTLQICISARLSPTPFLRYTSHARGARTSFGEKGDHLPKRLGIPIPPSVNVTNESADRTCPGSNRGSGGSELLDEPMECLNYSRAADGEVLSEAFLCRCECSTGFVSLCFSSSTIYNETHMRYESGCICNRDDSPIPSPALIEEEPLFVPDCVETTWLKEHGHSDGILREREASRVVCIPGLPCGTPGHLLRHCRSGSPLSCQLRTYADICTGRGDCQYRTTKVSRLRNEYDWSAVKRIEGNGESLQLTSVSVFPDSRRLSTSYAIAYVADWLGGVRLGVVCDYVLVLALGINDCGRRFWQYVHAVLGTQSSS